MATKKEWITSHWVEYWMCASLKKKGGMGARVVMFSATFNNISIISCQSVLMVEATAVSHCIIFNMMKEAITWQKQKVPWENNWPATSHWQTLSHNDMLYGVHLAWTEFELTSVISTDCIGSYKSNYHATTTAKEKGGWGSPKFIY